MTTPLVPVMLAGAAAAAARVVQALVAHEDFSAEPTLALICAVVLALLASTRAQPNLRSRRRDGLPGAPAIGAKRG